MVMALKEETMATTMTLSIRIDRGARGRASLVSRSCRGKSVKCSIQLRGCF
ncbi:hypothetical protein Godav_018668 [Gossypium davidsonii]|uniref:Uncharacterized protein n=2 Tax=Gossypium TaxID=3633 RepID=A0A7J8QX55_GOSDV|nr:hypothetical protein [Gossypium davidsonii]MBA0641113.1 hypothetical protein [Gossypium klotzschianum]